MKLATSSYSFFQAEMGLPCQTSRTAPKWWPESPHPPLLDDLMVLAPSWAVFHIGDEAEFERAYRASLYRRERYIISVLHELSRTYGDETTAVLLCWEDLRPPSTRWCHRRQAARWLVERELADEVPELS